MYLLLLKQDNEIFQTSLDPILRNFLWILFMLYLTIFLLNKTSQYFLCFQQQHF